MTSEPSTSDVPTISMARSRRGAALLKLGILLAAFGVLAVGTLVASLRGGERGAVGSAAIHEVVLDSFEVVLTANGDLDAREQTVLRSELETRSTITELVDEGVLVQEGDLLVRLSTDELEKQLDNELLSLETARSDLVSAENALDIQISDNESSLNKATLRVELAHIDMEKWLKGDDQEKQKQLALDIDSARREAERLQEKFERSKELFANNFLSSDELKKDELDAIKAQAALEKALLRQSVYMEYERTMELKRKQSEIDEAEAELDRVKRRNESQLESKRATVTNKKRQLALREERVAKLQEQIAAAEILAPTAGLVVYATSMRRNRWDDDGPLKVGMEVRPNEDLIVLPNNDEMVAKVNIHESLVGQVSKGQKARVRIDAARGRTFDGLVDSVGVIAESGGWRDPNLREYEVRILLDLGTRDHGLKPSMRCEAEVIVDRVEDAVTVPIQAVFQEGRVSYVFAPAGAKYERVPVGVGRRSESVAEVVSGLQPGDRVLLREPEPGEIVAGDFDQEEVARISAETRAAMVKAKGGAKAAPEGEQPDRQGAAGAPASQTNVAG